MAWSSTRSPTPAGSTGVVGTAAHLAAADAISNRTTTLVRNDDGVLPLAASGQDLLVTGYGVTTTRHARRGAGGARGHDDVHQTGSSPSDAAIADAVAAAAGRDAVVVTTMKAWDTTVTDQTRGQQKLVAALRGTGVPVVVVAVRDPYDIAYLGDAETYLATYSYSPVALRGGRPGHRRRGVAGREAARSTSRSPATPAPSSTRSAHGLTY